MGLHLSRHMGAFFQSNSFDPQVFRRLTSKEEIHMDAAISLLDAERQCLLQDSSSSSSHGGAGVGVGDDAVPQEAALAKSNFTARALCGLHHSQLG